MIIQNISLEKGSKGEQTLSAVVTYETPQPVSYSVFFRFENPPGDLIKTADPFLIGFLTPAMLLGEKIEVRAPVDAHLADRIRDEIMPLLNKWASALNIIELQCPEAEYRSPPKSPRGVAIPWAGGLDATYATVKNLDRIDWLVASQGFDTRSFHTKFWAQVLKDIRSAAEPLNKPLMIVSSNVREISHYQAIKTRRGRIDPSYYDLGPNGPFGIFLAAMGHCMEPFCAEMILSANVSYEALFPYGAHPLLDPLWSTPSQSMIHDGAEAGRIEKVAFLKEHLPETLNRLRVCWRPAPGELNCSQCEKCLRTMAEIRCNDAESLSSAFRWPIDFEKLRQFKPDHVHRFLWEQIQNTAASRGDVILARESRAFMKRGVPWSKSIAGWIARDDREQRARSNWRRLRKEMKPPEGMSDEVPTPKETLEEIERRRTTSNR